MTLLDAALELGYVTAEEFDNLVDPKKITMGGATPARPTWGPGLPLSS